MLKKLWWLVSDIFQRCCFLQFGLGHLFTLFPLSSILILSPAVLVWVPVEDGDLGRSILRVHEVGHYQPFQDFPTMCLFHVPSYGMDRLLLVSSATLKVALGKQQFLLDICWLFGASFRCGLVISLCCLLCRHLYCSHARFLAVVGLTLLICILCSFCCKCCP